MKTELLPKILANEKRGGLCNTPHAVVLRRYAPPPCLLPCLANNKVLNNLVRTAVFIEHAVRYLINSVPKPCS